MSRPLNVLSLHHVPFEGLGSLEKTILSGGHGLERIRMWTDPVLPVLGTGEGPEIVIVMGGPMSVGDTASHPWLVNEKEFLRRAVASGKTVLGICLGAQLIAEVLGAAVAPGTRKEIGWFPVTKDAEADGCAVGRVLPDRFECFHWHGDTFSLPPGAVPLGRSGVTPVQGFVHGERIVGLQFHLETTPESARDLIENCRDELAAGGEFIQSEKRIMGDKDGFAAANRLMEGIWEVLVNLDYT